MAGRAPGVRRPRPRCLVDRERWFCYPEAGRKSKEDGAMTTTTVPEAQQEMESQHERRAALRVSFVGAGTMAEAIIRGLLQRQVVAPSGALTWLKPTGSAPWRRTPRRYAMSTSCCCA